MLPNLDKELIGRRDVGFVGEGDFGFAVQFARRHPWLCHRMFASDINVNRRLYGQEGRTASNQDLRNNVLLLQTMGVLVGVLDAGNLPDGLRCSRMQFNCPRGYNALHIPHAIQGLVEWCAGRLARGGTFHLSCHGDQKVALTGINLAAVAQTHKLELVNFSTNLQERYGFTAKRTNGGSFVSSKVWEYVFASESDNTFGKGVSYTYKLHEGVFYHHVDKAHSQPIEPSQATFPAQQSFWADSNW